MAVDWTARIDELEEAKSDMIMAKRAIKHEAERTARMNVRREVEERISEVEYEFAKKLAQASADGIPQSVLRKDVLRTGDWGTWVKYRDLAGIKPERGVR